MKRFLALIFLGVFVFTTNAQNSERETVKQTILSFFEALHKQDTTTMRSMVNGNIKMHSMTINNNGETNLKERDFLQFTTSIASIPKDRVFEEKLLDFDIKVDGPMASVWTPYEFWYEEKLIHCGVNSFQLIKEEDSWKIMYLVDTRRQENCKK